MPIGPIPDYDLPEHHWEALYTAIDILTDEFCHDVADLLHGGLFVDTTMADFLPRKYQPKYTTLFAKQFLACLMTVAWKLRSPDTHLLACVGEELALNAIIEKAEMVMEGKGEPRDFNALYDGAFEDTDFKWLFRMEADGIEDTDTGRDLGMTQLHFDDWFKPFRKEEPVHPYVDHA